MVRVSFTGTRRGMRQTQAAQFSGLVSSLFAAEADNEWHDGDCVGADAYAHHVVAEIKRDHELAGVGTIRMIGHPGSLPSFYASNVFDESREPKDNLDRNKDMVNETEILVACPGEMDEIQRSGTWSTIRYARRLIKSGRRLFLFIVWPNGAITREPEAVTDG